MKVALLSTLISLLTISGLYLFQGNQQFTQDSQIENQDFQIFQAFQEWKSEFNMNFNGQDEEYRFTVFRQNYIFIETHNAQGSQLVLGLNQFSAMTLDEWAAISLGKIIKKNEEQKEQKQKKGEYQYSNLDIDWRKKGAVLPVVNQGKCGSCWAFSTASGMASLRYLVDGILERLSVQQLISCIPDKYLGEKKDRCGGSDTRWGYSYTHEDGIETWENYPYVSGLNGTVPACHHKKESSVFYNHGDLEDGENGYLHGYTRIPRGDVYSMKKWIQVQPFSGSVNAHTQYFKHYQSGILTEDTCGIRLTHSIFIVALYDIEGETPYWTIQNSWGPQWGENGYVRIEATEGDGVCGINLESDVPLSVNQQPDQYSQKIQQEIRN